MERLAATLVAWGPLGVFLLAILDSAGIPLPTAVDFTLVTIAAVDPKRAYLTAFIATVGSGIGCMILFYLARKGGELYLDKHSLTPRGRRFRRWFQHYGLLTVFIPALVPVPPLPTKLFVICAGALGVRPHSFLLAVMLARVPRYFGLAYLGTSMSENPMVWLREHALQLAAFEVGLFVFLLLLIKIKDRIRKAAAGT